MSVKVSSWVWEHAEVKSGDLVVLLALADNAHDDGGGAYPYQATLAAKARMSDRQVRNCLKSLESDGWIERQGVTSGGRIVWRVCMDRKKVPAGNELPSAAGNGLPTEPSVEPSLLREGAPARAKPPMKISGKPVVTDSWEMTEKILTEFNAQTGKKLRPVTSAGQPSEASKRIYGRVRVYPDITREEHADIIRRTLKSKWWGEGEVSIGVVYGPRVFEDNITRGLSSRAARDPNRFKRTRSVEED